MSSDSSKSTSVSSLAGALVLFSLLVGYIYLSFVGVPYPRAKALGLYRHTVTDLTEYCAYLKGEDVAKQNRATALDFDCEQLRDTAVRELHESTVAATSARYGLGSAMTSLMSSHRILGVWRVGSSLHIADPMIANSSLGMTFDEWKAQIRTTVDANAVETSSEFCNARTLQTLFTEIVIKGGDQGEIAVIPTSRKKFDPCGTRRK